MSHISPGAAWKLVHDSLVTSLKFEESGETDIFCKSYTFGKMTPILKVCKSEKAKVFGKEIHSDIGKSAQVKTKRE